MKARDWFIVGIRLFGVWMLIGFLNEMILLAEVQSGMFSVRTTTPAAYLFHGVVDLIVGCMLLWGATPLSAMFDWHASSVQDPPGFPIEPSK